MSERIPDEVPRFVEIRNRDLVDGQHRNETERIDYFTTAFLHRPGDLRIEIEAAGLARRLEAEPSIVGASAHLLGIGRR